MKQVESNIIEYFLGEINGIYIDDYNIYINLNHIMYKLYDILKDVTIAKENTFIDHLIQCITDAHEDEYDLKAKGLALEFCDIILDGVKNFESKNTTDLNILEFYITDTNSEIAKKYFNEYFSNINKKLKSGYYIS